MPDVIQLVIQATDAASKVIGGVGASLDKLDTSADSASKKLSIFGLTTDQIGSKMTQAGKIATVGLTLPIAGLAVAATKAASYLNETSTKIETLFGNASGAIKKFADTAATSLGQSKKQALDAAADFAIFGKAAGLAGNDLVDFSKKNVTLAADMASFFNTSPEEAITAIGAAFRGESEPIRRFGVLINEASLKDEALRLGLIKTTTEALQPQARVLAAQALIFKQTSAAQGDFAKTSGGLANQSRILNAQFQDTIATLGQSLLPVAIKMASTANDLLKAFNDLDQPTKDLIVGFGLLAAAAGPVLTVGGKLVGLFGTLTSVAIDAAGGMVSTGKTIAETAGYLKQVGVSTESLKFAFQNLKAAGVILGAELGIIIAGLIAIAKYLGEVDAASKATSEDLIAMSRSGDVFKQAAATTEILAHGQDRLKVALDGTHEKIRAGAKDYADYESSIRATANAAGYQIDAQGNLIKVYYGIGGEQRNLIEANYLLSESTYKVGESQNFVSVSAGNAARNYGVLDEAINRAKSRTAESTAATQADGTAIKKHTEIMREYAKQLLANAEAYQRTKINLADTTVLAIQYTESQKKQADVQKELDDLNAKIAARGPARVVTIAAEAKATTDLTASQGALSAARSAADDIAKRDNESSAQYAMRLKDAQANLKKLTDQMGSHIVTANALSTTDQKSALNQARLAAAQEDLATAQKKKGETDIEFALRVETIKGKIADYSKTLTEHTGVVGGATKAELEQKKALEEQIATLQKASEIDRAKGAFEALTASFRTGLLTEGQYQERVTALNAVTGLYTEAALKQATAQEILMKSFADPRSETWRGQLLLNQEAIDGQVNKTKELTGATDAAAESLKKVGVIPPIEVKAKVTLDDSDLKKAHDRAGDLKFAPPTIKPTVDTSGAEAEIKRYVTTNVETIPKEKKTTAIADTVTATRDTKALLLLYSAIPPIKKTEIFIDGKLANVTLDEILTKADRLYDRTVEIRVKYIEEGSPPNAKGYQYGGSYIVPPNPRGGLGDYFPILAAPGERVTVQTKAQQNAMPAPAQSGDTFNYVTNVYNPLAAAMLADKQRRDRLARSNARMGVV